MKLIEALTATAAFLIILLIIYYVHITFFKVDVVFYASITDGVLASILAGIAVVRLKFFRRLGDFEKLQLIAIWAVSGYAMAISVPTVIDRSLSIYVLEKIQQHGGGVRQDAFEQVIAQEYVKEHRLVDVRLTEQLESGTIVIDDGCVHLTEKGARLARFSRYFRQNWLPKRRLLMGRYTDDLTDPFRNSLSLRAYECHP
jgi:hypothetical protein